MLGVGTSFLSLFHFGFTTEELRPTVEKFCYLLIVPNSSEVICPSPLDDVNDSAPAELFGLNRGKVLDMIQGCKSGPSENNHGYQVSREHNHGPSAFSLLICFLLAWFPNLVRVFF